jgi:hypothetical protein
VLFSRQIAFIDNFEAQIYQTLKATFSEFGFVIVDFITNKQLFRQGIDGTEKKLLGYTRTTIKIKLSKGQPADRTTLRDEGDFYASIHVDAFDDRFEIVSDDPKSKGLVFKYGRDILRPTNANINEFFRTYFIPQLKQSVSGKFTR